MDPKTIPRVLPKRTRAAPYRARWLSMLWIGCCACSDPQSPEAEVRAVIDALQAAAETRDASDVMAFVAADFRSAEGQGFDDLQRSLRGYFLAHQSIHLLTRIEALEFPVAGEAHVRLSVGMAGRPLEAGAWELATDIEELQLVLRRTTVGWQVVHAARR
jgi:ketosteroid isomerase-like protein